VPALGHGPGPVDCDGVTLPRRSPRSTRPARSAQSAQSQLPLFWLVWLVAHAIPVVWIVVGHTSTGDVHYYRSGVSGAVTDAMTEYPEVGTWPAVFVNAVTDLVGGGQDTFVTVFIGLCVLLSALFTGWLLSEGSLRHGHGAGVRGARGTRTAAWFWVGFIAFSGPIAVTRLDLFPGVTVAWYAACLIAGSSRVRTAGTALLAVATMMKLWPGVLAAGLVGGLRRRSTWLRVGAFVAALAVLCALVVLLAGPERLTSPLTYQSDRGLQAESVLATPAMVAAAVAGTDAAGTSRWSIGYAASKSYEIEGPGVEALTTVSTVLMAAMILFALGWAVTRLIRDDWSRERALAFSAAMIMLVIVTNKVFSPQYLTWIAPLTAVALLAYRRRIVSVIAVELLVTAALTTVVYPSLYDWIIAVPPSPVPTMVLLLRNAMVLVLTVTCLWWCVTAGRGSRGRSGRRGQSASTSETARPVSAT
jgi:hypothetical protein